MGNHQQAFTFGAGTGMARLIVEMGEAMAGGMPRLSQPAI